jgi:phage nucleotide-binding protein
MFKTIETSAAPINRKRIWIYGVPFSGKTTFACHFPNPAILSTDGNFTQIREYSAGKLETWIIRDEVKVEGRQTLKKPAWLEFKDAIIELEKKQNNFRTIIVDLVEDVYQFARSYIYDVYKIKHESDNGLKYYDIIRTEFLQNLKRLMVLDYENIILLSHESSSRDITARNGEKFTSIRPNLIEKVALKIAGMCDIVARIVETRNGRMLNFKTSDVIFGGGRLRTEKSEIPLNYEEFVKIWEPETIPANNLPPILENNNFLNCANA